MPAMYEAAQVGKRQEIIDKVFNVEAAETPFLSWLPEGPIPNQLLASWVGEVYPDVPSTGILDGTAATNPQKVDRILMQGTGQHFRREWGVTTLANLTNMAGVGRKEAAHQAMLAMLLLKRQIEQQFLSNDDCAIESGGTPWTSRGVFQWMNSDAQAVLPVDAKLRTKTGSIYAGTLANLTQELFRTAMQGAYADRKAALSLDGFVGIELKAKIDDWTNVYPVASTTSQPRMQYVVQGQSVLHNYVDELRFSVGKARLHLSSYLFRTTATGAEHANSNKMGLFLDRSMWQKAWMMKPANTNLAPDGSGKKGFVDAVGILKCLNPLGQVKVEVSG